MKEKWKKIDSLTDKGLEYDISNRGRVRRVLGGSLTGEGYRTFKIGDKRMFAHRLVAQYFLNEGKSLLGRDEAGFQVVDHLNGKRDDNRVENLRITDARQNAMNVPAVRRAVRQQVLEEFGLLPVVS